MGHRVPRTPNIPSTRHMGHWWLKGQMAQGGQHTGYSDTGEGCPKHQACGALIMGGTRGTGQL